MAEVKLSEQHAKELEAKVLVTPDGYGPRLHVAGILAEWVEARMTEAAETARQEALAEAEEMREILTGLAIEPTYKDEDGEYCKFCGGTIVWRQKAVNKHHPGCRLTRARQLVSGESEVSE